jgi:hypothetical protein
MDDENRIGDDYGRESEYEERPYRNPYVKHNTDDQDDYDWSDLEPWLAGLRLKDPKRRRVRGLLNRTWRGVLGRECEIVLPDDARYREAEADEHLAILACLAKKGVTDKYLDPPRVRPERGFDWTDASQALDEEEAWVRDQRFARDPRPEEWVMPLTLAVNYSDGTWLCGLNPEFAAWCDATMERHALIERLLAEGSVTSQPHLTFENWLRTRKRMERDRRMLRRFIPLTKPMPEIVAQPYLACDRDYVRELRSRLRATDRLASACVECAFFWRGDPFDQPITLAEVARQVGLTGPRRADKALRAIRRGVWKMKVWAEQDGRVAGLERRPARRPQFDLHLKGVRGGERIYHESWDDLVRQLPEPVQLATDGRKFFKYPSDRHRFHDGARHSGGLDLPLGGLRAWITPRLGKIGTTGCRLSTSFGGRAATQRRSVSCGSCAAAPPGIASPARGRHRAGVPAGRLHGPV